MLWKGKGANPEWCSQASGILIQDLWSCTASNQPVQICAAPLHKEHENVVENGSFLGKLLSLVWPQRGAGPGGVPAGIVGTGMFSLLCCCLAVSSISCLWGQGGHTSSLPSPGWGGGTRLIHQRGGHEPHLMASVQACGSKDIPVLSLLMAVLSDNSLDPGVRGFPKPALSCKCR